MHSKIWREFSSKLTLKNSFFSKRNKHSILLKRRKSAVSLSNHGQSQTLRSFYEKISTNKNDKNENENENDNANANANANHTNLIFPAVGVSIGAMVIGGVLFKQYYEKALKEQYQASDDHTFLNYSGTHSVAPNQCFSPNSTKEVENLVKYCNDYNIPFRAMGTGLSPNGISHSSSAIMEMAHLNKILDINPSKLQVRVEAGIKIRDIIKEISKYDMALANIPSIQEQQIGGLIQTGAHGTGASIGPCDTQCIELTMVTPSKGTITLTPSDELFNYARVGLGCLGIVTEVVLQCVKRHKLKQSIRVMDLEEIAQQRNNLINDFKHLQILSIPYADNGQKAVVIGSNEVFDEDLHSQAMYNATLDETICQKPLRSLYASKTGIDVESMSDDLSFADLRDMLLAVNDSEDILNTNWVKQINNAELQYWKNLSEFSTQGYENMDYSENVLSFECGGQQWVYEVCFKINKYENNINGDQAREVTFIKDLLDQIYENGVPAPSPIEMRFTGPSSSYMSPAYSDDKDDAFCWVGIIFYLPTQDERKRRWIANEFHTYSRILDSVMDKYGGIGHWAKIENHYANQNQRLEMQERLKKKYGVRLSEFIEKSKEYDPKHLLVNDVISDFFSI